MKKTLLALSFVAIVGLFNAKAAEVNTVSNTSTEYVVNDANIDALFATSTDASYESTSIVNLAAAENAANSNPMFVKNGGSKNAITAILLAGFLGQLGVHRMYLGTATMTWIGYILTCGGCGIVSAVDFWIMIFNFNDISKFEDNSKFFMW